MNAAAKTIVMQVVPASSLRGSDIREEIVNTIASSRQTAGWLASINGEINRNRLAMEEDLGDFRKRLDFMRLESLCYLGDIKDLRRGRARLEDLAGALPEGDPLAIATKAEAEKIGKKERKYSTKLKKLIDMQRAELRSVDNHYGRLPLLPVERYVVPTVLYTGIGLIGVSFTFDMLDAVHNLPVPENVKAVTDTAGMLLALSGGIGRGLHYIVSAVQDVESVIQRFHIEIDEWNQRHPENTGEVARRTPTILGRIKARIFPSTS